MSLFVVTKRIQLKVTALPAMVRAGTIAVNLVEN